MKVGDMGGKRCDGEKVTSLATRVRCASVPCLPATATTAVSACDPGAGELNLTLGLGRVPRRPAVRVENHRFPLAKTPLAPVTTLARR